MTHISHLIHHRSCPFLAFPLLSFLPFSLLAPMSSDHLPLQHVQSSSSFCPISFLLIFSFLMIHVSHPYRTTGHTSVLTNLFLRSTQILLVSSSFLLLNASFAIPILVLTSSKHLTSSEINEPRYLNLLTCSTL